MNEFLLTRFYFLITEAKATWPKLKIHLPACKKQNGLTVMGDRAFLAINVKRKHNEETSEDSKSDPSDGIKSLVKLQVHKTKGKGKQAASNIPVEPLRKCGWPRKVIGATDKDDLPVAVPKW